MELQRQVVTNIADLGYRAEESRFHPHVTLGRLKPGVRSPVRDLSPILERHRSWTAGTFTAMEVVTVESELTRGTALHAPEPRALRGETENGPSPGMVP